MPPSTAPPVNSPAPLNVRTPLLFLSAAPKADVIQDPLARSMLGHAPDGQEPRVSGRASYGSFTSRVDYLHDGSPRRSRAVSLVLENCGSVARDHLALERTFLAYVRTSLTIASAGVALAQLLTLTDRLKTQIFVPLKPLEIYARPLAATSVVLALYVLFVGVSRYFTVQAALASGLFPAPRVRLGVISLSLGVIISVLIGLILGEGIQPHP
ncbi:hypothetical protein B0H13DRAFT_2658921 [Mycena leptocephala]|nr:hypothetical protein B0H13DRAFT_2658921 [Mycena leptocephala]